MIPQFALHRQLLTYSAVLVTLIFCGAFSSALAQNAPLAYGLRPVSCGCGSGVPSYFPSQPGYGNSQYPAGTNYESQAPYVHPGVTFGYYPTQWRRWPYGQPPVAVPPNPDAEQLPEPRPISGKQVPDQLPILDSVHPTTYRTRR
ncbi:MAG TPA: hypothetical protein VKS79_13880 [Gemmataceae bacterium]|nr:hypothetical protein [Gemmataceae bacterium]